MSVEHPKLKIVLCWHMHQPQYRDLISGEYHLPWVYLHTIKDYVDMAAHLEAVPKAKAVVNFAPILLDQIADYAEQVHEYLENSTSIRDPLLAALADPVLPKGPERRFELMKNCLRANKQHMIERFKPYQRLAEIADLFSAQVTVMEYMHDQFLVDILVWYHLAWLGESVRRQDARVQALIEKEKDYTLHDRRQLLTVIGELLSTVIGRYAALAETGQVELAVSPYAHPILPLMLDFSSAHDAMPDVPLPALKSYPGGESRVRWQLEKAIACFEHHFGRRPNGCWPSEGGVSTETLRVLDEFKFRWAASGEGVFRNSIASDKQSPDSQQEHILYRPYRVAGGNTVCFFRDDRLSDQIGFVYSDWHADDAVANLIHHLENIAEAFADKPETIVSLILDGENAWEYYPENGYYFLSALYRNLAEHPKFELTTFSSYLDQENEVDELTELVAGSWVSGTFSTWIGETEKNHGWDMLGDAKRAFDKAMKNNLPEDRRRMAEKQLAICEGSDWFWWFGGENPADIVSDFDRLYRVHLSHLYQLLHLEPPEYLAHSFTHGGGTPLHGGTMRPGREPE